MAKNQKTTALAVVVLLVVAGIVWGVYYYINNKTPESDTPPVLDISRTGSELFQGVVLGQAKDVGLAVEIVSQDLKSNAEIAGKFKDRVDNLKFAGQVGKSKYYLDAANGGALVTAPIGYYYSDIDITPAILKEKMELTGETSFFVAYYDSHVKKYFAYPPPPNTKVYEVFNLGVMDEDYEIPAFHGFVIYTDKNFKLPGHFYSAKTAVDAGITANNLVDSDEKGWVLLAVPQNIDKLKTSLNAKINSYFVQKDLISFNKNACDSEDNCQPGEYYMVWFNFGDGEVVAPPGLCRDDNCLDLDEVVDGQFNLDCTGLMCQKGKLEMSEDDLIGFGCSQSPKLCSDYGLREGDFPGLDDFFDEKFINQGNIDPSPIEDKIRDVMVMEDFTDFATDPGWDKLDVASREKLEQSFKNEAGGSYSKLAGEVLSQEFTDAAEKAMAEAEIELTAYAQENGSPASSEEVAAFLGAVLQDVLSDVGANLGSDSSLEASVDQALEENSSLSGEFSGAAGATFEANGSLLQGAGLKFNGGTNSFESIDVGGKGLNNSFNTGANDYGNGAANDFNF